MIRRSALLLLAAASVPAQQPDTEAALEAFHALDFRRKAAILRTIERQVEALPDAPIARIRAATLEVEPLPAATGDPMFDPAREASDEHRAGRAPSRRAVDADDPDYRSVRERFTRPAFLPELRREVVYDFGEGRLVKLPPHDYDARFANCLYGFAPRTDHAVARVLETFDRVLAEADAERSPKEPGLRGLAWWFDHTYCDLEARAFPGITLYDAWYSGEIVDVPDVDAVPYARELLGDRSLVSPLSGPPRDRLYAAIRAGALRYRIHRSICEAAAGAFVAAEPRMDPIYARLVPRLHYLFATCDDDVERVAREVARLGRDGMIGAVDASVQEGNGTAFEVREARRRELAETAARIRSLALATLERLGG